MKFRHFLNGVEHARILAAIQTAEQGTSGDIVLVITHRSVSDPLAAANKAFQRMHLDAARDKNSLLLFLAPKTQKFAVVGGTALHDRVGQAWWDSLIEILTRHFKAGNYTDGLVAAIDAAGLALRQHFPATTVDRSGQRDIVED